MRTFADFLVYEFSISPGGPQLNKCIEILNDMVWKYNIVTLDRLILCLVRRHWAPRINGIFALSCTAVTCSYGVQPEEFPKERPPHVLLTLPRSLLQAMRSHENNEAQVCYFIIQLLLLKPNDFRNRVNDFVKENAPEHWLQSDWHNKHMNYYKVKMNIYQK